MKVATERCDVCGKLREVVGGNWWSGTKLADGAYVTRFKESEEPVIHLCCIKCATTWFDIELKKLTPSIE